MVDLSAAQPLCPKATFPSGSASSSKSVLSNTFHAHRTGLSSQCQNLDPNYGELAPVITRLLGNSTSLAQQLEALAALYDRSQAQAATTSSSSSKLGSLLQNTLIGSITKSLTGGTASGSGSGSSTGATRALGRVGRRGGGSLLASY